MPKYLPARLTQYVLNNFYTRNALRTASLKTKLRLSSNDLKWRRSPVPSRYAGEVASSRCHTRRIAWDSLNHAGSGKWTSNALAPTFCDIGPAPRTNIGKLTAFTVGCALAQHSVSFVGTKPNVFWPPATLASRARSGFNAFATQYSPREPTFGTRDTMGCGGLGKSA